MNITVPSLAPGARSMPAEFRSGGNAMLRLKAGMHGMGDTCTSYDDEGNCMSYSSDDSSSGDTLVLPSGASINPGSSTEIPLIGPATPVYVTPTQQTQLASAGFTPAQIQQITSSGSAALNSALAISNGGSVTQLANGSLQITGNPNTAVNPLAAFGTALSSGNLTSLMPILLLAVGGFVLISALGSKK